MLRVLSPAEQSCLTVDAQALIYKYSSKKWLPHQELEELITQVVMISRMRHVPGDVNLITSVLHCMGDPPSLPRELDLNSDPADTDAFLS